MEMKFYSPLTAEFFPNEPDWEDESYNEYEGCPLNGHDLLQYADAVNEAVKKDIADFNGDLMQYYHEDDSVRSKVVSAVPSVKICAFNDLIPASRMCHGVSKSGSPTPREIASGISLTTSKNFRIPDGLICFTFSVTNSLIR